MYYNYKLMKSSNSNVIYDSQNTLLNDLVSYWDFNENANDRWINNNDGTVVGAALTTGKINQCYSFNGSTTKIEILDNPSNLNLAYNFSISCWFKRSGNSITGTYGTVISKYGPPENGYFLYIRNSDSAILLDGRNGNGNYLSSGVLMTIQDNIWYNVVITFELLVRKVYINGIYKGSATWTGGNGSTNNLLLTFGTLCTGAFTHSDNNRFNGTIDEIGYWNKLLSESEIKKLYKNGLGITFTNLSYVPKFYREPNIYTPKKVGYNLLKDLVSYWKFDNDNGIDSHRDNVGILNNITTNTGKINNCYSFNGSTSYIDFGKKSAWDIYDNKTFSFWFKTSSSTLGRFISTRNDTFLPDSNYYFFDFRIDSNGKVLYYVYNKTSGIAASVAFYSINALNNNQWHNFVATIDRPNNQSKLYIDGIIDNSSTYSLGNIIHTAELNAGRARATGNITNGPYNGLLDEVAIWDRTLSADEVKVLYNNGNGLSYDNFRY